MLRFRFLGYVIVRFRGKAAFIHRSLMADQQVPKNQHRQTAQKTLQQTLDKLQQTIQSCFRCLEGVDQPRENHESVVVKKQGP